MNGVKCCDEQEGASEVIFQKPTAFFGGVGVFLIWVFFSCFFFEIKKKLKYGWFTMLCLIYDIYHYIYIYIIIYIIYIHHDIWYISDSFPLQVSTGKYTQPKSWEICFIQWTFLGHQAWEAASQVTLRKLLCRGKRGAWKYEFCHKKQMVE